MKKGLMLLSLTLLAALSAVPAQAQSGTRPGYFTYYATKRSTTIEGNAITGRYERCHWAVTRVYHGYDGSFLEQPYGFTTTYGDSGWWGSPPPCPYPDMSVYGN